jgi:hypothetical protein
MHRFTPVSAAYGAKSKAHRRSDALSPCRAYSRGGTRTRDPGIMRNERGCFSPLSRSAPSMKGAL